MSLQRLSLTKLAREESPWFKVVADLEIGCAASGGGGRLFVKLDAAGGFIEIQPWENIPRQLLSDQGVQRLVEAGLGGRIQDSEPPQPAQDAEGRYLTPPITGYKPLTPEQLADINAVKALGATIEAECHRLAQAIQAAYMPNGDTMEDHHKRLAAHFHAREHLQTGLMWLTRSIANPSTFA